MSQRGKYDLSEAREIMAKGAEEFLPDYEGKRRAGRMLMAELAALDGFCGYVIRPGDHGLWFGVGEGYDRLGLWINEGVGSDLVITYPEGKGRTEKITGLALNRVTGLLEGEDNHRSAAAVVVEYALAAIRKQRQALVIRSPGGTPVPPGRVTSKSIPPPAPPLKDK